MSYYTSKLTPPESPSFRGGRIKKLKNYCHFVQKHVFFLITVLLVSPLNVYALYTENPTPTATATIAPTGTHHNSSPNPAKSPTPIPTDTFQFGLSSHIKISDVTVIPNPAWGTKLSFRVMLPAPSLVRIHIYNRNLEFFDKIEKEGNKVFDILWSLKNVPEGLYYYQVQVVDKKTGKVTMLPQANFAVMK